MLSQPFIFVIIQLFIRTHKVRLQRTARAAVPHPEKTECCLFKSDYSMIFIVLALCRPFGGHQLPQHVPGNQYRKQVHEQFSHSDKDALLTSKPNTSATAKKPRPKVCLSRKNKKNEEALRNLQEQDEIYAAKAKLAHPAQLKTDVELTVETTSPQKKSPTHRYRPEQRNYQAQPKPLLLQ